MRSYQALAIGLQEAFDADGDTSIRSWEKIARKVIMSMRDLTEYDVIKSDYCEHCPVRAVTERRLHEINRNHSDWYMGS